VTELAVDGFWEELEHLAELPAVARQAPRVLKLLLEGEVGRDVVSETDALLHSLTASGVTRVVIDFSEVSHLDYRCVPALVDRARALRALGGDLKLSGLSAYLDAIFRSAGAFDEFDAFPAIDEAIAAFDPRAR
jgi:anti-anti-sigma factor